MYESWVEVSKSAILHNLKQYQNLVGRGVEVMPVVKSNAYGHGMAEIAKIIAPKCRWLGVVTLAEALYLKKQGIRKKIFVLSYADKKDLTEGIRTGVDLPVYSLDFCRRISAAAKRAGKTARVHVKIDTGTTRVGILAKETVEFVSQINSMPNLKIVGLYSHFASSEDDATYTKQQLKVFNTAAKAIEDMGIKLEYKHFGCSAATLTTPDSHFNMVRLGVSLYGLWASPETKKTNQGRKKNFNLKPALVWKTRILQVKEISKGTKVGYGCSYTAPKKVKIAILAVGYWEGYDRHLSNQGIIVIKGKRCKVIGRVCMNLTMVDVSEVKGVKAGDVAELIGPKNTATEMAEKIGTINYEVVTRINPVLKRVYLK